MADRAAPPGRAGVNVVPGSDRTGRLARAVQAALNEATRRETGVECEATIMRARPNTGNVAPDVEAVTLVYKLPAENFQFGTDGERLTVSIVHTVRS